MVQQKMIEKTTKRDKETKTYLTEPRGWPNMVKESQQFDFETTANAFSNWGN